MLKRFPNCFFKLTILHSVTCYIKLAACPCNQDLTPWHSNWERSKTCLFMCLKYQLQLSWSELALVSKLICDTELIIPKYQLVQSTHRAEESNRLYLIPLPEVPSEICSGISAHIQPQGPNPKQSLAQQHGLFLLCQQTGGMMKSTSAVPPSCEFSLHPASTLPPVLLHGHPDPFYSDITDCSLTSCLSGKPVDKAN